MGGCADDEATGIPSSVGESGLSLSLAIISGDQETTDWTFNPPNSVYGTARGAAWALSRLIVLC